MGKRLPGACYLHESALGLLPAPLEALLRGVADRLLPRAEWNLVKLHKDDFKMTFLNYPDFDRYPYPALAESYLVDLGQMTMSQADYSCRGNPPILHRRESFVADSHPHRKDFEAYTEQGERLGLYAETSKIGTRRGWEAAIHQQGHALDGNGNIVSLDN